MPVKNVGVHKILASCLLLHWIEARTACANPPMSNSILWRSFLPSSPARRTSTHFLAWTVAGYISWLFLPSIFAQADYKEPDYSKLQPESGQITLEVWTWVVGLDKAAPAFRKGVPEHQGAY